MISVWFTMANEIKNKGIVKVKVYKEVYNSRFFKSKKKNEKKNLIYNTSHKCTSK